MFARITSKRGSHHANTSVLFRPPLYTPFYIHVVKLGFTGVSDRGIHFFLFLYKLSVLVLTSTHNTRVVRKVRGHL